jgi:hypothetical protein
MAEQGPPVSFRSVTLEPELAARTPEGRGLGWVAKRDLGRYYALLRLLRHDVALSVGEALVICAAMRDIVQDSRREVHVDMWNAPYALLPRAADAVDFRRFGLTAEHRQRWGVDGTALRSKVAMWSFEQRCAVLDGVELFWLRCTSIDDEHAAEVLAEAGLVQTESGAAPETTRREGAANADLH